jgi:hypothetical protein
MSEEARTGIALREGDPHSVQAYANADTDLQSFQANAPALGIRDLGPLHAEATQRAQ